jgi:hypothetical protein
MGSSRAAAAARLERSRASLQQHPDQARTVPVHGTKMNKCFSAQIFAQHLWIDIRNVQ